MIIPTHLYYVEATMAVSLECMELMVVVTLFWLWSTAFNRKSSHEPSASVVKCRHLCYKSQ